MKMPITIAIVTTAAIDRIIRIQLSLMKINPCIINHIMPYRIPQWMILPISLPLMKPLLYKPPTIPKAKSYSMKTMNAGNIQFNKKLLNKGSV